jgi:hypothetical protein
MHIQGGMSLATDHFLSLLFAYSLTAAACSGWVLTRRPSWLVAVCMIAALGLLGLVTAYGALETRPANYLMHLARQIRGRDALHLLMLLLGGTLGSLWAGLLNAATGPRGAVWGALSLVASGGVVSVLMIRTHAPELVRGRPVADPRFTLDLVADLPEEPCCVAAGPGESVYVSYDLFRDGREASTIVRYTPEPGGGWKMNDAGGGQQMLYCRPFGLTWHDDALYVSRSGRFVKAGPAGFECVSTGAVTRLRDTTGDGVFDDVLDVVQELPGTQMPDSQHSNNGIAFGPSGELYVAVGSPGNRLIGQHPFEGSILRVPPGGGEPEVFARGFRNPFGMAIGPKGSLFISDNDVDDNPGDEVNHVRAGEHYGHPYTHPGEGSGIPGYTDPIFLGSQNGNLTGLAYTESENLPEEYRGCLYVADLALNQIIRLRLAPEGETFRVTEAKPIIFVQRPVGVTISDSGTFYVATRRPHNKLWRVRFTN